MTVLNTPLFPDPTTASPSLEPMLTVNQAIDPLRQAWHALEQALAEFKDTALPAFAEANGLASVRSVHVYRNYSLHAPAYDMQAELDLPRDAASDERIAAIRAWAEILDAKLSPSSSFVNGNTLCTPIKVAVPLTPQTSLTFQTHVDLPIAAPEVMAGLGPTAVAKDSESSASAVHGGSR